MIKNLKPEVLLITEFIPHYRIPIYTLLALEVNLTIIHNQIELKFSRFQFTNLYVDKVKLGPFFIFKTNLNKVCKKFDVVIGEGNIRFLDRNLLILWPFRKYKWISWGIGQAASYKKKLGDKDLLKKFRLFIQKKCDANLLYSNSPIKMHLDALIDKKSIFVAHNTISLNKIATPKKNKKNILFIGTLYKQKKLEELIEAYSQALLICSDIGNLEIIGDGSEKNNLTKYVKKLGLDKRIIFFGHIEDSHCLSKHFANAIICVSPGQAGLSVLTSLANSVPFITKSNAITGGEIFNIIDSSRDIGFVYNRKEELIEIICNTVKDREKFIKMGDNARKYYVKNRLPKHMVDSILKAVQYVLGL